MDYFKSNKLFYTQQFRFSRGRSTVTQLYILDK